MRHHLRWRWRWTRWTRATCLLTSLVGCGSGQLGGEAVDFSREGVVYGRDDRRDYYELSDLGQRRLLEHHAVALMGVGAASALIDHSSQLRSWQSVEGLCADERFADQPVAAFCSGVLVANDLVLTAEHCLDFAPLHQLRVAFGYYETSPGKLAMRPEDLYSIESVLARSSDFDSTDELDFVWLRLGRAARQTPATLNHDPAAPAIGDRLLTVNAGGGTPVKLDDGLDVLAVTDASFVATSDTFRGASGGGAFDAGGALLGVFRSGRPDFTKSGSGCLRASERPPDAARERFTRLGSALSAYCCAVAPGERALASCPSDCAALSGPSGTPGSCAFVPSPPHRATGGRSGPLPLHVLLAFTFRRHRRRSKPPSSPPSTPE